MHTASRHLPVQIVPIATVDCHEQSLYQTVNIAYLPMISVRYDLERAGHRGVGAVNIVQALADKQFFGALPAFDDLSTWSSWIVFAKPIYGTTLDHAELEIFAK